MCRIQSFLIFLQLFLFFFLMTGRWTHRQIQHNSHFTLPNWPFLDRCRDWRIKLKSACLTHFRLHFLPRRILQMMSENRDTFSSIYSETPLLTLSDTFVPKADCLHVHWCSHSCKKEAQPSTECIEMNTVFRNLAFVQKITFFFCWSAVRNNILGFALLTCHNKNGP